MVGIETAARVRDQLALCASRPSVPGRTTATSCR
jgi:hypothetical protein